jgi:hypothetical protein
LRPATRSSGSMRPCRAAILLHEGARPPSVPDDAQHDQSSPRAPPPPPQKRELVHGHHEAQKLTIPAPRRSAGGPRCRRVDQAGSGRAADRGQGQLAAEEGATALQDHEGQERRVDKETCAGDAQVNRRPPAVTAGQWAS